jgi:hypothetical protein
LHILIVSPQSVQNVRCCILLHCTALTALHCTALISYAT